MSKSVEKAVIDKILFNIQKPVRYSGGELNLVEKDNPDIRFGISYPDLYEIGMSNNGIKIIYDVVSQIEYAACERVFPVADDMEKSLRENGLPLYTLDSLIPVKDLDMLGFNVSHELLYTNILQVLDLSGIPLLVKERGEGDPVIIAGGEAISNPFPIADFIDLFYMGDGEEGIPELIEVLHNSKKSNLKREDVIKKLSEIEGVLNPSDYSFDYTNGNITGFTGKKVKKRIYRKKELSDPVKPPVTNMRITQERAVLELARGCYNQCKFCHAGFYELPYRTYPFENVVSKVKEIIRNTGYNELTLSSLSISDYAELPDLLNNLLPWLNESGISISLPSLKVDMKTIPVIEAISNIRKTSLTFAIESASDEIRSIANKKVRMDDLFKIVDYVFDNGWRSMKFYIMLGLPGCEEHDEAEATINLFKKIVYRIGKGNDLSVTLSPFIPKPHTPFENEKQMSMEYFYDIITRIKRGIPRSVKVKSHNVKSSMLEGVFSRGDSKLGKVIYHAYLDGCKMDSWKEHFNFRVWEKNLNSYYPSWENLLEKREGDVFQWSMIETGFEKTVEAQKKTKLDLSSYENKFSEYNTELKSEKFNKSLELFEKKYEVVKTVRFKFVKKGFAKYISHLDFVEIVKRAFRMVELPMSFTQGFNKREKLSFGFPVPVGIESLSEYCDADLYSEIGTNLLSAINDKLPENIELLEYRSIEDRESIQANTGYSVYTVTVVDEKLFDTICGNIENKIPFERKNKKGDILTVEFDKAVVKCIINSDDNTVSFTTPMGNSDSIRADRLVAALGEMDEDLYYAFFIIKVKQFKKDWGEF